MESYVGQITLFAGDAPPPGWRRCDGADIGVTEPDQQILGVIGAKFGSHYHGTGCLPDMRDREPAGMMYIICCNGVVAGA